MSQQIRLDADEPVWVEDLGVRVGPGPIWVDKTAAQASACLQALLKLKKVRQSAGARCRVSKDPPKKPAVHSVHLSRNRGLNRHRGQQPPPKIDGLTPEEAQKMVAEAAAAAAQQAIASMAPMMQSMMNAAQTTPDASALEDRLEQVVTKVLGNVRMMGGAGGGTEGEAFGGPEEPLFIPTGIVRDGAESLDVQSESSGGGEGLDDAASALKALRKSSPAKKKTSRKKK